MSFAPLVEVRPFDSYLVSPRSPHWAFFYLLFFIQIKGRIITPNLRL